MITKYKSYGIIPLSLAMLLIQNNSHTFQAINQTVIASQSQPEKRRVKVTIRRIIIPSAGANQRQNRKPLSFQEFSNKLRNDSFALRMKILEINNSISGNMSSQSLRNNQKILTDHIHALIGNSNELIHLSKPLDQSHALENNKSTLLDNYQAINQGMVALRNIQLAILKESKQLKREYSKCSSYKSIKPFQLLKNNGYKNNRKLKNKVNKFASHTKAWENIKQELMDNSKALQEHYQLSKGILQVYHQFMETMIHKQTMCSQKELKKVKVKSVKLSDETLEKNLQLLEINQETLKKIKDKLESNTNTLKEIQSLQ